MSSNKDPSGSKDRGKPEPPATNFDDLLAKIDNPPPKPKRQSSLLKRAATVVDHVADAFNHLGEQARKKKQEAAAKRVERLRNLRDSVLGQGNTVKEEDLWDLAEYEGVYLNPRPSSKRIKSKDLLGIELAAWVVARVAGPMTEGKYKGHYFFLGRSKSMYVGLDKLGADSRQLDLDDEYPFAHIRETARAYYSLCD